MQLVYITHAVGRRIAESNLVPAPLLHDLFGDPTLRGQQRARASIGVAVFLILPNTQRSDKVKGRKGKRANVLVEFRCARLWSIGVWWWSPFFAIVMLHELLVKMFEGVKSRACPGVCVFYYCRTYYKAVRVGGGGEWRTCAMRDDKPRPVWMSLPITH